MDQFQVMALLVLVISFFCGMLVKRVFKLDRTAFGFATPIGFVVYLAILEIGYVIFTCLSLYGEIYINYTYGVSAAILIASIFNWRGIGHHFVDLWNSKTKLFLALAIFSAFVLVYNHIQIDFRMDDINFYGSFVPNRINYIVSDSNVIYGYQGYYALISTAYQIALRWIATGFFKEVYLPLAFLVWFPAYLTFWVMSFGVVDFLGVLKAKVKKLPLALILGAGILVLSLLDYWYFQAPHMGNTVRRIAALYLIYLMDRQFHGADISNAVLMSLVITGYFAMSSSAFFIEVMFLYAYLVYSLITDRRGYVAELLIMAICPFTYTYLYLGYNSFVLIGVLVVYILCLILILVKAMPTVEKYLHYLGWPLFVLVPLGLALLPQLGVLTPDQIGAATTGRGFFDNLNYLDSTPDLFVMGLDAASLPRTCFNILYWVTGIVASVVGFKKKNPTLMLFLILVITFFNPFVFDSVATLMTSMGYYRITDLFFNAFFFIQVFLVLMSCSKKLVYKLFIVAICCVMAVCKGLSFNLNRYLNKDPEDYALAYHASKTDMTVVDILMNDYVDKLKADDEAWEDGRIKIASQIYGIELFTNETVFNTLEDRFAYMVIEGNEYEQMFQRRLPGYDDYDVDYNRACALAFSKNTDYIILDAQYNWELQEGLWPCASVIFEEGNYRVLKMNREYYNWNIKQGDTEVYPDIEGN